MKCTEYPRTPTCNALQSGGTHKQSQFWYLFNTQLTLKLVSTFSGHMPPPPPPTHWVRVTHIFYLSRNEDSGHVRTAGQGQGEVATSQDPWEVVNSGLDTAHSLKIRSCPVCTVQYLHGLRAVKSAVNIPMQYGLLHRAIKQHSAIVQIWLINQSWASKAQIRTIWGIFRYRKSANFLGNPVRKSQICKFLGLVSKSKSANFYKILQTLSQNSSKGRLFTRFLLCTNFNQSFIL